MKRIRTFLKQLAETYVVTARHDKTIWLQLLAVFIVSWATFGAIGEMLGGFAFYYYLVLGFIVAILVTMIYFGPRARRAAFVSIEGQPGAAAAVLQDMRGGWTTTPGVAVNKNRDIVHRVVCRAGIVLVAEGSARTSRDLLTSEERRTSRFAQGVAITLVSTGREPGQIALTKLQKHMKSLPKKLRPAEVTKVRRRLEALGTGAQLPIPKGPMPRQSRGR